MKAIEAEKKKKIILKTISEIIEIKPIQIKLSNGIGDFEKWDSLAHIRIFLAIKKKLKYVGSTNNLSNVRTVNDWIKFFLNAK